MRTVADAKEILKVISSLMMRRTAATLGAVLASLAMAVPALALSVTVNGQATVFNPPPIERAGRVFVPLRGVFEALGASVVYEGGVINATGNGQRISLTIGSQSATVNGQAQTLDVAPFIIGASTYVPLRFVSEALGAGVNYDATNQIVALTTHGSMAGQSRMAPPPGAMPMTHEHYLRNLQPAYGGTVASTRPTLQGEFSEPVDPNSVRVTLDGRDVSSGATVSPSGFIYSPASPLESTQHTAMITGKLQSGEPFQEPYNFTSGTAAPVNSVIVRSPPDDSTVPSTFTITGRTIPNGRVHIVAGSTASVGGVFAFGTGNYTGDTIADGRGDFSQSVTLQTVSGASIGVTVISTDPATKEAAEKKLRLKAQ
jgi:Copper amine oxidase N-terminal domain